MKKYLLLSLLLVGCVGSSLIHAQETGFQTTGISVTGSGTVYGEPDLALLELGVDVTDEHVSAASDEADRTVRAVIAALSAAGVAEKDIRTASYNVWREDRYDSNNAPTIPLYHVSNTLNITVRDVSKVGDLLAASLEAGANTVNNVQYTFANPDVLARQARELAMQDALAKAQQLADLAGVHPRAGRDDQRHLGRRRPRYAGRSALQRGRRKRAGVRRSVVGEYFGGGALRD